MRNEEKMKNWILFVLIAGITVLYTSCATTHPNEKLIVGEWKPVNVEKYFTPEEEEQLKQAQMQQKESRPSAGGAPSALPSRPSSDPGIGSGQAGGKSTEDQLFRLMKAESRANIIIYPDKTAAKLYHDRIIKATWKLRGKGTVLVAKDLAKNERFRIDILEVGPNHLVVVENLPVGGIKISYERMDTEKEDLAQ